MPRIKCKCGHAIYMFKKRALYGCKRLILRSSLAGDPSWRYLNVFKCHANGVACWHVGRSRTRQKFPKDFERFLEARYQAALWNEEVNLCANRLAQEYLARNLQPRQPA